MDGNGPPGDRPALARAQVRSPRRELIRPLLLALTVAVVAWVAATTAARSRLATVTIAAVAGVVVVLTIARWVIDRRHQAAPAAPGSLAQGDREYPLRAPIVLYVVMLLCSVAAAGAWFIGRWQWAAGLGFFGGLAALAVARALILRQRITVTETHAVVPVSLWSARRRAVPLEYLAMRVWGLPERPTLELKADGVEIDVAVGLLGEDRFAELAEVLQHRRTAALRRREGRS